MMKSFLILLNYMPSISNNNQCGGHIVLMKKYILLTVLVFCANIAFSQKYWAESIEEGLKEGAENIRDLHIVRRPSSPDFTKLSLFINLVRLTIDDKVISDFPIEITTLSKLKTLSIYKPLAPLHIPKEIIKLKYLESISLDSVSNIPEELFELTKIENIYLRGQFSKIPENIENLTNLRSLYLRSNKSCFLPESIRYLQKLENLMIHHPEASISNAVLELSNLVRLDITSKKMQALPSAILKLRKLSVLYINAPIKELPPEFRRLSLQELVLLNTQLQDSSSHLLDFFNLRTLTIHKGFLTKIPSSLYSLPFLEDLSITNNKIDAIDEDWMKFKSLTRISLGGNPIKKLPANLPEHLRIIDISNTQISSIPESWYITSGQKTSLETIFVGNTFISPEEKSKIDKNSGSIFFIYEVTGTPTEDR